MADVTGPISSLPGSVHVRPLDGAMCDEHPDRRAVHRVQGETDSFGCEMHDLCDECLKKFQSAPTPKGRCGWCSQKDVSLYPRRDYEEGLTGPVYYVCIDCCVRQHDELRREFTGD